MSAVNVIQHRDAIHIVSDGAGYDAAGNLLFTAPKVWPLLKQKAMFAVRGPALLCPIVAGRLFALGEDFDDMKEGLVEALRAAIDCSGDALSMCQAGDDLELVFAGWSRSGEPDSFVVANHSNSGLEPWKIAQTGPVAVAPGEVRSPSRLQSSHIKLH